jgi:AraC family transcriptional regulator, transcriptional activator of pobA
MLSATCSLKQNGFTTYAVESHGAPTQYQGRNAYYKMLFISGIGEIEYGDTRYHINGPVLLFTKPAVTCRWSLSEAHHSTYICAFSNGFLDSECLSWSEHCESYFASTPVFHLSAEQETFVRAIFRRMVEEQQSAYAFKEELIQNQLCVLKHMALRMTAAKKSVCSTVRIIPPSAVSLELVELGFPLAVQALHFN